MEEYCHLDHQRTRIKEAGYKLSNGVNIEFTRKLKGTLLTRDM
jgi:hypothetical protein